MVNCRRTITLAGLVAWVALAANLNAQQPGQNVAIDVTRCQELETREAQVECYGELVADELDSQPAQAEQAADITAVAAPPIAASARRKPTPEYPPDMSRSERRAARKAAQEQEREEARLAEEAASITATVTELRELQPNHWLVTLDNEQVWRQNRAQRYVLEVGDEVTLTPSSWGPSYRLRDPDRGGFIQVERIR